MNTVQPARLAAVAAQGARLLSAAIGRLQRKKNQLLLLALIVVSLALVATLDFWTSAALVGSILFTFPLTLCAFQPSKRLLWAVATGVCLLTVAAGFWGMNRVAGPASWEVVTNRGLLVSSLLLCAAFIHVRLGRTEASALATANMGHQSNNLATQNEKLETLVAAAARDAGERKVVEEHLVQMEARYRGLMEAAPDAMVVVNELGEIVLLNLQAEKQFGYSRDELLGQPVKNIIPQGFAERLIADGARTAAEALAQQIGTGLELVARRKDGSAFPIELMLSPLESEESGILVTAAIRDIGVRKEAEAHLAQMEARYRGLLEAAPDAMVVVNEAGEIVLLNLQAEKQFGYPRDELLGQPVTNIIPQGFAERLVTDGARTAAEALAQQIGTGLDLIAQRKDGSAFPIELMLSPLESEEGILVTAAIRDVTVRHAAQEAAKQREALERTAMELTRSNDDLQQFAYVAAHDLQEPLRMVSSYTQLLAERYKGRLDADADQYIEFAVNGAYRMQLLIGDLLAYCQVGTAEKDLREISTKDALEQALLNLHGAIRESGGTVTHDTLPQVVADRSQLVQLFQNVVGNAIKYRSDAPPLIHVSATQNQALEWIFSIRDNGLGIDPLYYDKVFVMFKRLHGRGEFSGTGIGLSLCKKIAERHGGRMWVESAPGNGSTFYLALPGRAGVREAA